MTVQSWILLGILLGGAAIPLLVLLLKGLHVEVEDEEALLITRFGRLIVTLKEPGWHWLLDRLFPWTDVHRISLRRDYREIENICVNDATGTTLRVDVFLEYRVVDPVKAVFEVQGWEAALTNLISHSVISTLGDRPFEAILSDRTELAERVQHDISAETQRWGIQVEEVFLRDVSVLPEVAQQMFHAVAARLERAKAEIEEHGRQRAARLEAETSVRIAELVAEARGQYPLAMGRAFATLKQTPQVLAAYNELYELSLVQPQRLTAFKGFKDGELRPVDSAMLVPPSGAETAGNRFLTHGGGAAEGAFGKRHLHENSGE